VRFRHYFNYTPRRSDIPALLQLHAEVTFRHYFNYTGHTEATFQHYFNFKYM
jgi:hypothetical protein